ncbi:MAG: sigma-70 family RNA polymerase sigma factor [Calditrichaeota bacterium]|nr:sigma-70 family RNA polymerase sigma factor [Calditrichota bacterium]
MSDSNSSDHLKNDQQFQEWISIIRQGGEWERRIDRNHLSDEEYQEGLIAITAMQDAAAQIYSHFADEVTRLVSRKISPDDVFKEDIRLALIKDTRQQILTSVILYIRNGHYSPEKGNLPSLVFGIAKNKINDGLEKIYREIHFKISIDRQFYDRFELIDQQVDLEEKLRKEELFKTIHLLRRNKKHAKYWKILKLKHIDGLSNNQIKNAMNLESTAKVAELINYAIKLLRKKLDAPDYLGILAFAMSILHQLFETTV